MNDTFVTKAVTNSYGRYMLVEPTKRHTRIVSVPTSEILRQQHAADVFELAQRELAKLYFHGPFV